MLAVQSSQRDYNFPIKGRRIGEIMVEKSQVLRHEHSSEETDNLPFYYQIYSFATWDLLE